MLQNKITSDMLIIPSANVLNPRIVRFLYFFRRWSMTCNLFTSLFKKCGYCKKINKNNMMS